MAELRRRYKPSLFQHIGTFSSLKGKVQKLKVRYFQCFPSCHFMYLLSAVKVMYFSQHAGLFFFLTWDELVKRDRVLPGMERTDPEDRQAWRGRLRPQLGSQAAPSAED